MVDNMQQGEVIFVESPETQCNGGHENLGHPTVYIALKENINVACPYCAQLFCFAPKDHNKKNL